MHQQGGERKVPVLRSENSLIKDEFDSIRGRFEEEMRKMESEMARFRSQLVSSISTSKSSSSSKTIRTTTTTATAGGASLPQANTDHKQEEDASKQETGMINSSQASRTTPDEVVNKSDQEADLRGSILPGLEAKGEPRHSWLDEFVATNSPLITSSPADGNKVLKLRFDVSAYEPEQITVKTVDNKLHVHAQRQETSANRSLFSEYNKEFLLPEGTQLDLIKSCLSADGILTIESPLPSSVGRHKVMS